MISVQKDQNNLNNNQFDPEIFIQNDNTRKNGIKRSKYCTCEVGKLNAFGKKVLRYSVCDYCSEQIFVRTSKNQN